MWENYRSWLRWYLVAKYEDTEASKVSRLVYKNYLKQNGYEDIHKILDEGKISANQEGYDRLSKIRLSE